MSLFGNKKSPSSNSIPFLKKRLRRISALGVYNLAVNEFNFAVHFTLHRNEKTVAFYSSESIENQRSPEWLYLKFPSSVQCLQDFVMRIWLTSSNGYRLFLEYDIHLDDSLIPDKQKETVTKGNNTLWLEIFNYRFTENDENDQILPVQPKQRIRTAGSYTKLSIIRMNNVLHAIRTEKQASAVYLQQSEARVEANRDYLSKVKERESRQLRIETLKQYLQYQTNMNQQRLMAGQQKQKLLDERRYQLNQSLPQISLQQEEINSCLQHLNQSKSILRNLIQIISYRQREIICEVYRYIYPIEHENQKGYSIANVYLPQAEDSTYQSSSSRERDREITAAIEYSSHFILIISQFIHLPLRFPIDYHGMPMIKIYDYSSLDINEYPLQPTTDLSAFRYGFYLLNRNLGQMMYHCRVGDRTTDYRNTLENLKELIEEHFIHSNLTHTLQPTKSVNLQSEHGKSVASSFSSFISFTSTNEDDELEFFPPIKPRLARQISHPIQY